MQYKEIIAVGCEIYKTHSDTVCIIFVFFFLLVHKVEGLSRPATGGQTSRSTVWKWSNPHCLNVSLNQLLSKRNMDSIYTST